ncbi:uncharacterized protein A1O5_12710 [Cladophialophora psammophila CBS 110553]|uniref:L-lactate dehydrogenase (Cytochrome) n=1 Tax=Cladophialophora psammophila CBS 110553 TaxID=1182543 RepID=W9WCK7_9EURO|nr:uncharacterized protein A1O5_12710 [Cladophialophora psammophila CBS 110553]EXJ56254.1 hypothetical protein A1O5_12710 [Cladophialophora psammophila CBS 110553]
MIRGEEVLKHNTTESCWVIVHGQVYDVTNFLGDHPGGSTVVLRHAGKDVSEIFDPIHPKGILGETLTMKQILGPVDPASSITKASLPRTNVENTSPENKALPLSLCMNLDDLEMSACRVMSRRATTFITSGADSLASVRRNRKDWSKIIFRPRVLRNVARADMRRNILGKKSSLPFFIAPMGMAKLAHNEGELALVRGAVAKNIPYCVSGYSSIRHDELMACHKESGKGGFLFYQLYVAKSGEDATRQLIRTARNLGYEALFVTVDAPVIGKREEDERYKAELDYAARGAEEIVRTPQTTSNEAPPVLRGTHSYTLSWDDLRYIRDAWGASSGPVVIKGIQTAEDAKIAADMGFDGIYLSNHGGRQLDYAPSSIRTLLEIRRFCPEILSKVQIFLDGGIRRGTDIIKALCLGATAVGIGRPFNYGIALDGLAGCNKVTQLLSDEIETTMRLLGVTDLGQLGPEMVNCRALEEQLPTSLKSFHAEPRARI